jgi:hypothetical protein
VHSVYRLMSLILVLGIGLVCAEGPKSEPGDPNVVARYKVARDGDILLLPVKYRGKTYQFFLDTGASHNVFDASLPLGNPIGEMQTIGPAGAVSLKYYEAPPASVGGLSLNTSDPILGFDHTKFREVTGYEVYGAVGMSFLRRHVLQVDFDNGEVLVLKKPGQDCGQGFVVTYDEQMQPRISAFVAGDYQQEFQLDTAFSDTCRLAPKSFDAVYNRGALKVVGTAYNVSISGTTPTRIGQLKQLSLGGFILHGAVVGEGDNRLGLGFFSHFVMTLDFANSKLYLKKAKSFDRVDTYGLSGLHILRKDGKVIVNPVDKRSSAEAAGIGAGDILVKVDDVKADMLSMFQLRKRFSTETKRLRVTIQRGKKETEVALALSHAK